LRQDPKNGFALVHLGFIVKTGDRDYTTAIPLLRDGIASNVPGVIDGRFFLQLGDALFRTGQHSEVELSLSTMAHGNLSYLSYTGTLRLTRWSTGLNLADLAVPVWPLVHFSICC